MRNLNSGKKQSGEFRGVDFDWPAILGSLVVSGLFLVLGLTAAGGWEWTAKFLESAAPAWVQAVGSVAAIVAAFVITGHQHKLEIARIRSEERLNRRRRLRALRAIFVSTAQTCANIAQEVEDNHSEAYWILKASSLTQARERFLSIDPLMVPSEQLSMLIEQAVNQLHEASVLVQQLNEKKGAEGKTKY